jgi:hypothetical protein
VSKFGFYFICFLAVPSNPSEVVEIELRNISDKGSNKQNSKSKKEPPTTLV